MLGVDEFGDEEGGGALLGLVWVGEGERGRREAYVGDGDAEAEDEAADDEERDVEADADEGDADEHDGAADDDAGAAAEDVGGVGDEGDGEHGADGHGGGDEAEDLAVGVVEVYVRVS